jgi:zinc/manganese transport system substrate-binding protein
MSFHPVMARTLTWCVTLLACCAAAAEGALNIVATTSSMAMLARTVGGDAVAVTVLAPPDRDAHYLLVRPSMMLALRRADLLIAVGADLEVGWLPAALQGARNARILPGQQGYFEGAAQIPLIEVGGPADRARGDVHPLGNPHFYMDPERMAVLAGALAERLAQLDPASRAKFVAGAEAFAARVTARVPEWRAIAGKSQGVVLYHRDATYLTTLLGVPVLGYVEPIPGIPPTASHLRELVRSLTGVRGVILHNTFQSSDGPDFLARNLGWPRAQLPLEVGLDASAIDYLAHIGAWVDAMVRANQ